LEHGFKISYFMLIFLYGADTFRLSRKLEQIVAEYNGRSKGLDFAVFDGADNRQDIFFTGLRQRSLFGEKKFFIVKNPIANKNFKEGLLDGMDEIAASVHNILFYQEGKVLKADRFLKAMAKHGQAQEFLPLDGVRLEQWIAREFAELGHSEGASIAPVLALRAGNDLWHVYNEIQKIVHFAAGRRITAVDVEKNVCAISSNNIFQTVDAIADRSKKRAIEMIKRHVQKGDHPLYLLTMIAAQFKNLLLVKSCVSAGAVRLGIHPYVFSKSVRQARQFDLDQLKEYYRQIRQTDFDIKTGKIDASAGLDLLIAAM